jgi:Zn-finger nucleic acid-binding protein
MGQMRQYERSGIMVDQCTECRGIFLDRGELERLVSAESSWHGSGPAGHPQQPQRHRDYDSDEYPMYGQQQGHGQQGYGQQGHGQHGHKKRRGFLEELFD